jgi:hypothetical protein
MRKYNWTITFVDRGSNRSIDVETSGILTAIEFYCNKGYDIFDILSIEKTELEYK